MQYNRVYYVVIGIYNLLSCLMVLYLQFFVMDNRRLKNELEITSQLLHQSKIRYQDNKKNVDLINLKCHDLKHQIRTFGNECSLDEKSVSSLMEKASIYDSSLKTGNEALDILLMEKSLACFHNNIRLTTMAEGKAISFMEETEIYSLLGNALDNAIEAVEKVKENDKKVIGLIIKKAGSFVSIHLYNYCQEKPNFKDGFPVTTKASKLDHGYGLKSIRLIAEKYHGVVTTSYENETFSLDILFPAQ